MKERFWVKVDRSGECWLWQSSLNNRGYGMFSLGGRGSSPQLAHRVAYEMEHGPIPAGIQLDHICHVRHCVRPDHLRLATNKQNGEHRRGAQSNSKTGVRGVSPHASGKWIGQVHHHGQNIYVGLFDSIEAAEAAVVAKRQELFTHSE